MHFMEDVRQQNGNYARRCSLACIDVGVGVEQRWRVDIPWSPATMDRVFAEVQKA